MPETPEDLASSLSELTQPGYREKLIARGLARGLIWRNGILPSDAPEFSPELSTDLLDHGFLVLSQALRLRDLERTNEMVARGLYVAAEAIESASRHASRNDSERGFHLTMAAAAFHIGGYTARAFSLFEGSLDTMNLSSCEQSLVYLMRRRFRDLRANTAGWLQDPKNSDEGVATRLEHDDEYTIEDVVGTALTQLFHRAIATYEVALLSGREQYFNGAIELLQEGLEHAAEAQHVPLWWAFNVSRHLFDDLWGNTLHNLLPVDGGPEDWPPLRRRFIEFLSSGRTAQVDLWPSQVDAAKRAVDTDDDLVVALPTSAGKTRIAELCILRALADGKRAIYVTPLRALSAQIEYGLAETFRPLGFSVTSVYGASGVAESDLETLVSANIVVATPEKVDFAIRQQPSIIDDVALIVLDEGHMIGLSEREIRYEMLVQRLLRRNDAASRRIVCLSAVFTEGDAFDDFTAWLRSDDPGEAIRSTWRPTRQRPGILTWREYSEKAKARIGTDAPGYGWLEFEVEGENPFVPHFVDSQPPQKPRRKFFPNDDQEFIVATTAAFIDREQTVLIYCPIKTSVETTAQAFLKAHSLGFFDPVIGAPQRAEVADAIRIGEEWLGKEHPAVQCLSLGIAVHHGALPRQFLGEIENLLRRRVLPICVCSPTLAQGLDLSFSVLLFRSLYRVGEPIPAKEFANVIGRVGRAFVDLDGLYVLPIFATDRWTTNKRIREFTRLIQRARQRELESGVRELVQLIVNILALRLDVSPDDLAEYVLNQSSSWEVPEVEDDTQKLHEVLRSAINELDTAILGVVDALDLPTADVADYLDQCLQSSYWQRRLLRGTEEDKELQETVLRGRAQWLWHRSTTATRRAFFAAGIGYRAGAAINDQLDELEKHLQAAEDAIVGNDIEAAIGPTIELAEILYTVGPFERETAIENWQDILAEWLRGTALGSCTDNMGVEFVQEDVVYRLVWAVEATRLHLAHAKAQENPPGATLALCLTYGVPSPTAAVLMQGGIRSRTLATELSGQIGITFNDMAELRNWVRMIRNGEVKAPVFDSDAKTAEWEHFLERFKHHHIARWRDIDELLPVKWFGNAPNPKRRVRIIRNSAHPNGLVTDIEFGPLGVIRAKSDIKSNHFFGIVHDDPRYVRASFFGR